MPSRLFSVRGAASFVVTATLVFSTAACSEDASTTDDAGGLVAAVASYDLVSDRPSRFMVGLYTADQSRTLGYGTVTFAFEYIGARDEPAPVNPPEFGPIEASFLPIPGQGIPEDTITGRPELVAGSVTTGVYAAPEVAFDRPGFWEVSVTAEVDGQVQSTTGAFEVLAGSDIPAVGEPALQTRQPLAGDPSVDPRSIDSRAGTATPVPDPELHDVTVADALTSGRPIMIVVSTPTFCVSRFCGPITDSVQDLAGRYGDRMEFIHLEVWQDFAANQLNPSAAEWIAPNPDREGGEPWVFVVDGDGIIVERFDNVASDAELEAAVEAALAGADG
jgi:hypothetical protein